MEDKFKEYIRKYVSDLMDNAGYVDSEYAICHCRAFTGEDVEEAMLSFGNFILETISSEDASKN